ncbi:MULTISPECIES: hypothetical protein [unclassified Streptomyces]|uniref:hypothetical protein n=1 Tax=unclassified Streptomyces TaxID=2593676 RepID=UPI002E28ADC8|nr:hypothetical protein [Streptomyces sp. NBC_00223]
MVRTLADGTGTRFDAWTDGSDLWAAFSPDGRSLAVLSADTARASDGTVEDLLTVGVIDLATGDRRRLWSGPGRAPAERVISWSPGGGHLSVLHENLDEEFTVTVLDTGSGIRVSHFTEREVLSCPQGAWCSDRELVMFPEHPDGDEGPGTPTLAGDVVSGTARQLERAGALPASCFAVAGGQQIGPFPPYGIGTATLDGCGPRLLLTTRR